MYKVKIKDIQSKYTFKIFCSGGDTSTIETEIGDLASLTTTTKTDLVSAINEVNGNTSTNATAISGLQSSKLDASKVKTAYNTTSGNVYDVTYINSLVGDIESILETLDIGEGV